MLVGQALFHESAGALALKRFVGPHGPAACRHVVLDERHHILLFSVVHVVVSGGVGRSLFGLLVVDFVVGCLQIVSLSHFLCLLICRKTTPRPSLGRLLLSIASFRIYLTRLPSPKIRISSMRTNQIRT